jgi:hypothetical protein
MGYFCVIKSHGVLGKVPQSTVLGLWGKRLEKNWMKVSRGTHSEGNGFLHRLCLSPMPRCLDIDPIQKYLAEANIVTITNPFSMAVCITRPQPNWRSNAPGLVLYRASWNGLIF